jgi:hypothetical protein
MSKPNESHKCWTATIGRNKPLTALPLNDRYW